MHRAIFALNALALTTIVLVAYATDVMRDAELDTVDARFAIRGEQKPPDDLLVVAIDDVTFSRLKEQWPFPRSLHARAIDRLRRAGARTIAYDVQFTEQTDPKEDGALIDAVARARNVVLATTEVDDKGRSNVFGGGGILREIGARDGNALLPTDPGGVLRRLSYDVAGLRSFAVVAAETATGRRVDPGRLDDDGHAWIDYHGPAGTIDTVSFSQLVRGQVPRRLVRDRIVVVGPAALSLQDVHPTSTADEDLMAGVEIQANAIATVLRDFPLREAPRALDVALIVLLGLIGPLTGLRFGPRRSALIGLGAGVLFALGVQLAFNGGWIVSFLYPMASLVLGVVISLALGLMVGAFERERMRDLFSRFVPEPVVDEVLARADDGVRLGGARRTATVMFSDIRGFTGYAESRPPDQVIDVLNHYLTAMSNVILDNGGTLVSYMGDGIMAVFGAPMDQADHADRAVAAARQMAGETLRQFNDWVRGHGHADGFRIGIGLNSGPVMSGNVGSERRLEYTAIGDTTNTAARLEAMTKDTPHMVFIADSTHQLLTREAAGLVPVDDLQIRGRGEKVRVWSLGTPEIARPTDDSEDTASAVEEEEAREQAE